MLRLTPCLALHLALCLALHHALCLALRLALCLALRLALCLALHLALAAFLFYHPRVFTASDGWRVASQMLLFNLPPGAPDTCDDGCCHRRVWCLVEP